MKVDGMSPGTDVWRHAVHSGVEPMDKPFDPVEVEQDLDGPPCEGCLCHARGSFQRFQTTGSGLRADLVLSPGTLKLCCGTADYRRSGPMWPDIPYQPWRETCAALHFYTQIVGKYRLARTPWVNHSWHATLYVNSRGLTTSLIPDSPGAIEIAFDLVEHTVIGMASDGRTAAFPLEPMSASEFHARFVNLIASLGGTPELNGRQNEVPTPVAFRDARSASPYDAVAVTRFFQAV